MLRFYAYFKQTVHESPQEFYRVRPVVIFYYLEDDSISVVEPVRENSGMPQGKLIKRQRLPKNDVGDIWHWKDLNNKVNVTFYGKVFYITDCDKFTSVSLNICSLRVLLLVLELHISWCQTHQRRLSPLSPITLCNWNKYICLIDLLAITSMNCCEKKLLILLHILIKEKCLHCEYGTCLEKNVI